MAVKQVFFVGDSLIAFYEWQDYFKGIDCVQMGVPGETVGGWLHLTSLAVSRCPSPDYLVVMLGANNLWQQDFTFCGAYRELIDEFRRLYPQTRIVVCSLLPHELSWLAPSAIPRLNDALRQIVEEGGDLFVDVCSAFLLDPAGCFLEDGVHVSQKGYGKWCESLSGVLVD